MEFYLTKTDTMTFKAAYDSDADVARKIPIGECIKGNYKQKRNIKHHQKMFVFFNKIAIPNMPEEIPKKFHNQKWLLEAVKIYLGYFETTIDINGNDYPKTFSISFAEMDQGEFEKFYNGAIDFVLKFCLKDITAEQLDKEVMQFL